MTTRRPARPLLLLCALLVLILPALAQFHSGIEGSVSDPSGALVPDVNITVRNLSTGETRTVRTSSAGYYRVEPLPAGRFSITATATGFKTYLNNDVPVEADQVRTVNI